MDRQERWNSRCIIDSQEFTTDLLNALLFCGTGRTAGRSLPAAQAHPKIRPASECSLACGKGGRVSHVATRLALSWLRTLHQEIHCCWLFEADYIVQTEVIASVRSLPNGEWPQGAMSRHIFLDCQKGLWTSAFWPVFFPYNNRTATTWVKSLFHQAVRPSMEDFVSSKTLFWEDGVSRI